MHICDRCKYEFKSNYNLQQHKNKKIKCNIKREYKCDNCQIEFRDNYHLIRHLNRKFKCTSVALPIQNSITNNITNNTNTNSNNNSTNIFNNIIIAHEDIKQHIIKECYSLKDIKKMLDHEKIQEFLEIATVDKNYDEDDILQNTKEIGLLLKYIFCNINVQKNFIFFKDFVENKIYYKLNENEIKNLALNDIIYVIYIVFEELLNYDDLDEELQKFYKKYIKKYNDQEFRELDTKEIKNFVRKIKNELNNSLTDLYENIKLFKSGKFQLLSKKEKLEKDKLIINKNDRNTKLLEENTNPVMKYNNKKIIILLKELFKDDKNYDEDYKIKICDKTFYYEDIKYIKLLSYFIAELYI